MSILKRIRGEDGSWVVPVHWSYDDEKNEEWYRAQRALYSSLTDCQRELDIDFRNVLGAPVYENYEARLHDDSRVVLRPDYPVLLGLDFNVQPMCWVVCQRYKDYLLQIDEMYAEVCSVPVMCKYFKEKYMNFHKSPLIVYGDATGYNRSFTNLNAQGAIEIFLTNMQDYQVPIELRIPFKNPGEKLRVAAVNARLKDRNGKSWFRIHPDCVQTKQDLQEVVWNDRGNKILKIYGKDNDYYKRTHMSDGLGYIICYEWPFIMNLDEVESDKKGGKKGRKPLKYGKMLGNFR